MLKIEAKQWLVNGVNWYTPSRGVDLTEYKFVELLQQNFAGDIFIAWNEDKANDSRIFSGVWREDETLINIDELINLRRSDITKS
jgi:hypothetical protein